MRLRTRTTIIVGAVTAAVLAGGVSPAAAVSEQAAAAEAVAGRMLEAPRADALVKRLPVRVVVRVPARTSRLWVRVGGRNVTARFRRTRGSLRLAHLGRGDGLRYGRNHLSMLAERRGGRPVVDTRSFVLARRHPELVRLRVRRGPVTSLNLRVAGEATLAQEHFGQPGEVARRLAVIRRERTVRVWLNGRPITRAVDRSRPTRWTASLSATHGLRYGVNRLRILVAEPDRGRYAVLRRRFVVRRDRHLAAAGWDTATTVRGSVRLDGRRSRTTHGGRPDHTWRILSKPRGSRAKLRRTGSARPLLTPDRRGRYVIGLTVRARTKRVSASQATSSSADRVTVTAGPASLRVPFKALTYQGGPGIQVGDTFYPNPRPGEIQWLTLDRATLTPTKEGNSWVDATWAGDHGIKMFSDAVSPPNPGEPDDPNKLGLDQLVILSYAVPAFRPDPAVPPDQLDAFNTALKAVGVGPIKQPMSAETLAVVGVPSGGDGSGWYTLGSSIQDLLKGWLMPDATSDSSGAARFRFRPERVAFDTSSSSTANTNTMTLGDRRLDAALPAGATGGFQLVMFDPIDLSVYDNEVYATNGVADPVSGLTAMANLLTGVTGPPQHVAVQSIGRVAPSPNHGDPAFNAWYDLSQALAAYGANPHIFNTVDRSYAFLGGSTLERGEVLDSSSAFVIDPTKNPPKRESGTLSGDMSSGADGYFEPVATSPSDSFESPLYDIVFQDPAPWPYTCSTCDPNTPGAAVDVAAYKRALADITAKLPDLKDWYPDLRQAYVGDDTLPYDHSSTFLANLPYPGDGRTCTQDPGPPDPSKPAFTRYTREQFCNLSDELQLEFDWLDLIRNRFETYETVLTRSSGPEQANLQAIGTAIQTAVAPPSSRDLEIAAAVGEYVLEGFEALALFFAPEVLLAAEFAADVVQLAIALASTDDGKPAGDQVKAKVDDLSAELANKLFNSVNAMDAVRDVIISDYGRLKALGKLDGWSIKRPALATALTGTANSYFSSELMPVGYEVYALVGSDDPETCRDAVYGHTWRGAPASAQMEWMGGYDLFGEKHQQARFLLGLHHLSIRYYAYPPATLTDKMFRVSTTGDGWNVYLPRFVWEQYDAPPGKKFPPTGITYCH
jgi:hypothetical protein